MGGTFVASVPAVPVGVMEAFAGSSAPTGWLLCDGTAVSRTTYSNLYSVIGTTYGVGDGSTTFGLPDMRGRVPMGAGTGNQLNASGSGAITGGTGMTARAAGAFGGEETHLLSSAEIPAHSHPVSDAGHNHGAIATAGVGGGATVAGWTVGGASGANATNFAYTGSSTTGLTVSNNTGGGGRHAVVPPFVVLNYVIKAIPDTPRGGMTATFTPPIVTSLPLVPQFGDQVVYAADATNGVYWLLQYDASGTYPWKFIGGPPLVDVVAGGSATASPSYVALSGPTRSIVLPGDYDISASFSASYAGNGAAGMGVQIGAGSDEDYAWGITASPGYNTTHVGTYRKTVSSAVTLTSKVKSPQSVSVTFFERVLRTTPVRVKAA